MIFKKTLFVLTLIAINVIAKASASGTDTQKQPVKKRGSKKTSVLTLSDTASKVEDVPVEGESTVMTASSGEQPAPLVNKQFERLIEQEKYSEVEKLGESISNEEFLKQLCPLIVSPAHYNGLYGCLKRRKMVPDFFVHGKGNVVREVIAGIEGYDTRDYIKSGDLNVAIPLAIKEDEHDRAMNLLVARQKGTAENDKRCKQKSLSTSFEGFMFWFIHSLVSWKDSKSLKRFMTLKGEELNNKHPAVYENFGRQLMECLIYKLDDPNGKKLMADLVGQPDLLTLTAFTKGFLWRASNIARSNFITYGWREAVQEGLKKEYPDGGEKLWIVMGKEFPNRFFGLYTDTEEWRAAVCKDIPTKQQREEAWIKENAPIFVKNLEGIVPLPTVLWSIVFGYSPLTWIQV